MWLMPKCTVLQKNNNKEMIRNEHACTSYVNSQCQMICKWLKQIYIAVEWLMMRRCAAVTQYIYQWWWECWCWCWCWCWFPVWWVTEQLLPALTLVLDISVGCRAERRLFTSHFVNKKAVILLHTSTISCFCLYIYNSSNIWKCCDIQHVVKGALWSFCVAFGC